MGSFVRTHPRKKSVSFLHHDASSMSYPCIPRSDYPLLNPSCSLRRTSETYRPATGSSEFDQSNVRFSGPSERRTFGSRSTKGHRSNGVCEASASKEWAHTAGGSSAGRNPAHKVSLMKTVFFQWKANRYRSDQDRGVNMMVL